MDTGRGIWMGEGRWIETLDPFFENMPENVRSGIETVAIDLREAHINSIRKGYPQADIVFDLFHVVKAFNEVIDKIRNEEFREADREGRELLKGSKYLLPRRDENLRRDHCARLKEVPAVNERLNAVCWLKDLLVTIWSYHHRRIQGNPGQESDEPRSQLRSSSLRARSVQG